MPIPAEWQGRQVTIFVSREVLEDLAEMRGNREPPEGGHTAAFTKHRAKTLILT